MKKAFIAIAAILAVAAGCAKEDFKSAISFSSGEVGGPVKTVNGQIAADTKAGLDYEAGQQFWAEEDAIIVYARVKDPTKQANTDTMKYAKFVLTEGAGTAKGTFESETGIDEIDRYYAVYPFDKGFVAKMGKTADNDEIHVEYAGKQNYNEITYMAEGNNLMVSASASTDFHFYNICSYVGLMISGPNDDQIQSIVIRSLDETVINGEAVVKFVGGKPVVEFTGDGNDASIISFYDYDNAINGVDFWDETEVDIAVPPVMNGGFSVTVVTANGLEMTKTSDTPLGISQKVLMPLFDFEAAPASAEVDGLEYPSFKAALKAANEAGADCTIKLIRDCHIAGIAEVSNVDAVITLDLNGHKLSAIGDNRINVLMDSKGFVIEDNSPEQTGVIEQVYSGGNAVLSYGHLTVNSGTIIGGLAAIYVYNGVLEVNGGTFMGGATSTGVITVNSSADAAYAVDSAVFRSGLVKATARGMYFKGGCDNIVMYDGWKVDAGKIPVFNTDCHVIINGGQYISVGTNPVSDRTQPSPGIEIHGGYFYTGGSVSIVYGRANQTIVDGGYFARTVGKDYVAEGYQCQGCEVEYDGHTYLYQVVKQASLQATLQVDGGEIQNFPRVTQALEECLKYDKQTSVVTLQASCTMGSNASGTSFALPSDFSGTIILDLNGYTLNTAGKNARINVDGGTLTIRSTGDNGANGTLACLPADSYSLYQTGGTVNIEGGRFIGADNNQYYCVYGNGGGTMNISGGYFYCDYFQTLRFQGEGSEINISGGEFISNGKTKKGLADTLNEAIYLTGSTKAKLTGGYATSVCSYAGSSLELDGFNADIVMKVSDGELTIKGGNFDKGTVLDAHSAGSVINVEGGTFAGVGISGAEVIGNGTVNISGGSFSSDTKAALKQTTAQVNITGGDYTAAYKFGTVWSYDGGGIVIDDATVASGRIEGAQTRALYIGDGNDAAKGKGNITINGGKFTSGNTIARVYGGNLSVKGGTFTAQDTIFHCGSIGNTNAAITNGYFSSTNAECEMFCGSDFEESVDGGHFNREFNDLYVAAGKKIADAPVTEGGVIYQYAVVEDPDAKDLITVNGTPYQSMAKAFKAVAAMTGDIAIQLLESGKCAAIEFNDAQNVSIDFNGKVLSTTIVSNAKTLNISDSSVEGTGGLDGTKALVALTVNSGTVNMTGGTITGTSNGAVYLNGPKGEGVEVPVFNMNGGKLVSNAKPSSLGGSTGTYATLSFVDGGVFNLIDGEIENTNSSSTTALYIRASSADSGATKPTFNMKGGKLTGAYYAFYTYTQAQLNFEGGQITSGNRIAHNGTSNANVNINIKGGYFHAASYTAGRIISGYNATSVQVMHISGGYWTDDPIANGKAAATNTPLKLEEGYKVIELATPVVIGDLTYKYQVVPE